MVEKDRLEGMIDRALEGKLTHSDLFRFSDPEVANSYLEAKTAQTKAQSKRARQKDFLYLLGEFFWPLILGIFLGAVITTLIFIYIKNEKASFFWGMLIGFLLMPVYKKIKSLF